MDGTKLYTVLEEKDLGVLIDEELKLYKHVSAAVSTTNQTLGIIKRACNTLDKELLPIFYKHQVRPHLEYGNAIWHPRYIADIKQVEGVQHRATTVIPETQTLPRKTSELKLVLNGIQKKKGRHDPGMYNLT